MCVCVAFGSSRSGAAAKLPSHFPIRALPGRLSFTGGLASMPRSSSAVPLAPTLCFLVHANGLCKEAWAPFVEELAALLGLEATPARALQLSSRRDVCTVRLGECLQLVLVDLPGHGSAPPLALSEEATDWMQFARHLHELVAECLSAMSTTPAECCVIAHSLGGGVALLAQHTVQHRLFGRMLLFEPMYLFVEDRLRDFLGLHPLTGKMGHPLAQQILKRRARWADSADASADLSNKGFYAGWDPRALNGYLEGGITGSGPVNLACTPATEGTILATGAP